MDMDELEATEGEDEAEGVCGSGSELAGLKAKGTRVEGGCRWSGSEVEKAWLRRSRDRLLAIFL